MCKTTIDWGGRGSGPATETLHVPGGGAKWRIDGLDYTVLAIYQTQYTWSLSLFLVYFPQGIGIRRIGSEIIKDEITWSLYASLDEHLANFITVF